MAAETQREKERLRDSARWRSLWQNLEPIAGDYLNSFIVQDLMDLHIRAFLDYPYRHE